MATVLIYLQPATEGGNTVFPNTNIRVSPKAGDALLFYDLTPTGEGDTNSFHAGEPVIKGSKWALTKWIRQKKIMVLVLLSDKRRTTKSGRRRQRIHQNEKTKSFKLKLS